MAQVIKYNSKAILKQIFYSEHVVALPTDTVWGLACLYDSKNAFNKLVNLKQRPDDKPFSLLFKDMDQVKEYCSLSSIEEKFMKKFFPGKITILLKLQVRVPYQVDFGTGVVGVRLIKDDEIEMLMEAVQKPIMLTSCNVSGEKTLESIEEIQETFGENLHTILKGHIKMENEPTTIVQFEDEMVKILREGSISKNEIKDFVREERLK